MTLSLFESPPAHIQTATLFPPVAPNAPEYVPSQHPIADSPNESPTNESPTETEPGQDVAGTDEVDGAAAEQNGKPEDNITENHTTTALSYWPHQSRAIKNVVFHVSGKTNPNRVKRTLVVHPTGTGKTITMGGLAVRATSRRSDCLWLVPQGPPIGSLVKQARTSLQAMGRRGIVEKADQDGFAEFLIRREEEERKPEHLRQGQIIIASAATLQGKRLARWVPYFDKKLLMLIDEAHHAPAPGCRRIIDTFPRATVVGFTATPDRADGENLGQIFESLADEYDLTEAIKDGWLAPPLWLPLVVKPALDLRNIAISVDGDLNNDQLEEQLLDNMERLVSELKPAIAGRRTLAFTPNIRSAHALCEGLKQVGVRAAWIASADINGRPWSEEAREKVIDDFEAGYYDVLVNPILLAEGFDRKFIDCVAILRPTKSRSLYCQMVGRGIRGYPGKENCLIVDLAIDGHQLATVTDLFRNDERSKEVTDRAEELVREGKYQDVMAALDAAEQDHQIELAKILTLKERSASAQRLVYDPLAALEVIGWKRPQQEGKWYQSVPATDADKAWLAKYYNKKKQVIDVDSLSYYAAKELKRTTLNRIKQNLASASQVALMISRGMNPQEAVRVKFSEVDAVLAALRGN